MRGKYFAFFAVLIFTLSILNAANIHGFVVNSADNAFETGTLIIKSVIKEGNSLTKTLEIENINSEVFSVRSNIDFLSIDEPDFSLGIRETKDVTLTFNVADKSPGVYSGKIIVSSDKGLMELPVIIEIETNEVLFDNVLSVPLRSSSVNRGDDFVVDSEFFNLENIGPKNVVVEYFIKNLDGKVISSEKENIAVEKSVVVTKAFPMPDDLEKGNYLFMIIMTYKNSVGTNSYLFEVEGKSVGSVFGENFYIWIVLILLIIVVVFILYSQRQRDKLLMQLARQHRGAISNEIKLIEKEKAKLKKLSSAEQRIKLKESIRRKKHKVKIINRIYKTRIKIVKKLRRQKKKTELQRKIAEWNKQGYNTKEFLISSSKTKKGNLKNQTKQFKNQGYKF